jgi:hypothetical protein
MMIHLSDLKARSRMAAFLSAASGERIKGEVSIFTCGSIKARNGGRPLGTVWSWLTAGFRVYETITEFNRGIIDQLGHLKGFELAVAAVGRDEAGLFS